MKEGFRHSLGPAENGKVPVVFVNGYLYRTDVDEGHEDSPLTQLFPIWGLMVNGPWLDGSWHSKPTIVDAWRNGRWNTYRRSWDLAETAGHRLRAELLDRQGFSPVDIVCHSLGSRVVLGMLQYDMDLSRHIRRIILLQGAEHVSTALAAAGRQPSIQIYNIAVWRDKVLAGPGGLFSPRRVYEPCVGRDGLGDQAPANWWEIHLDDQKHKAWAARLGMDIHGDDNREWADHRVSFSDVRNWELVRRCLRGDWHGPI